MEPSRKINELVFGQDPTPPRSGSAEPQRALKGVVAVIGLRYASRYGTSVILDHGGLQCWTLGTSPRHLQSVRYHQLLFRGDDRDSD